VVGFKDLAQLIMGDDTIAILIEDHKGEFQPGGGGGGGGRNWGGGGGRGKQAFVVTIIITNIIFSISRHH